jgi:hypothetical protein
MGRRSITFLLVGLILLLAGGAAAAFLPLVACPHCSGPIWSIPEHCWRCRGSYRISFVDRWRRGGAEAEEWDGRVVSSIAMEGFAMTKKKRARGLLRIAPGDILTPEKVHAAIQAVMQTNDYINVSLYGVPDPQAPDKVILKMFVVEKSTALLDDPGSPDE